MSRDKVHVLQFPKRKAARGESRWSRLPLDMLFLAGLAVAFVLAHMSDKPPLVDKPISLERSDGKHVAENNQIGVRVIETGLRQLER